MLETLLSTTKMAESSAYNKKLLLTAPDISLTYNKSGPSIDPWGAPHEIFACEDRVSDTVNPLYKDHFCSKLPLTLKLICYYKKMPTSTRIPHYDHLVSENILQMNLNAIASIAYIISSS